MIWIILAILVVGYFIVKAINRSTVNNAVIAQQQYLNSPEYKKQAQASMAYWSYLNDVLDYQIWIAETKLDLLNPPKQLYTSFNRKTGELQEGKMLTDRSAVLHELKAKLKDHEQTLSELKNEYEKGKLDYVGYHPENLETMKVKYDLAIPFDSDYDTETGKGYLNTDMDSSWSMYEERQIKLRRAQAKIDNFKKGVSPEKTDLQDAIKVVREEDKASISLLQRKLQIGYNEASKLIDKLEKLGIIGAATNRFSPREVLAKNELPNRVNK